MPASAAQTEPEGATVGVKALRATCAAARVAGLDVAALLAGHGIALASLDDPDHRLAHATWVALWKAIETASHDPGIGLHTAVALPHGHWDVIDYLAASSATLGEAFACFERYFALVSTAVEHRLELGDPHARLLRKHRAGTARCRPATELAFVSVVRRFGAVTLAPWRPVEVTFTHAPSVPPAEYAAIFGCPVRWGASEDAIVLARAALDLPIARPEPELCAVLERHAKDRLASVPVPADALDARVMRAIVPALPGGVPPLAATAKRLGLGARTLQRRLREGGLAYSALVERVREELARAYLADGAIGLAEAGYLLGFSDPSAFYRAFRRWTGETPGAFRTRLRGGP